MKKSIYTQVFTCAVLALIALTTPNVSYAFLGGFTSIGDMFDGGGPGASRSSGGSNSPNGTGSSNESNNSRRSGGLFGNGGFLGTGLFSGANRNTDDATPRQSNSWQDSQYFSDQQEREVFNNRTGEWETHYRQTGEGSSGNRAGSAYNSVAVQGDSNNLINNLDISVNASASEITASDRYGVTVEASVTLSDYSGPVTAPPAQQRANDYQNTSPGAPIGNQSGNVYTGAAAGNSTPDSAAIPDAQTNSAGTPYNDLSNAVGQTPGSSTGAASNAPNSIGNQQTYPGAPRNNDFYTNTEQQQNSLGAPATAGAPVAASTANVARVPFVIDGTLEVQPNCTGEYRTIATEQYRYTSIEEGSYTFTITGSVPDFPTNCYAFAVNTNRSITETDYTDNRIQFNNVTTNQDWNTGRPTGSLGAQDTPTGSTVVTDEDVSPNNTIELEVQVRNAGGSIVEDWTEADVIISETDQLSFRWNAEDYEQCLADLKYRSNVFGLGIDITAITGNTETNAIDVREWSDVYSVGCTGPNGSHKREIGVTVR